MAEYKGRKVTLNKPRRIGKGKPGYGKKSKEVFVKNKNGNTHIKNNMKQFINY